MWQRKNQFNFAQDHLPAQESLGQTQIHQKIDCFTEFDPLQVVIIGTIDHTTRTYMCQNQYAKGIIQKKDPINRSQDSIQAQETEVQWEALPVQITDNARKQQEHIVAQLQKRGIKVVRSGYVDHSLQFETNGIKTKGFNNFNARDLIFTFDDSLYEFPCLAHCRKNQMKCFQWIEQKLAKNDSKIFKAPDLQFDYIIYEKPENALIYKTDAIFADGANLLKLGLDILYQVSTSGSWGSYKLFRKMMEERYQQKVRVHPICDVYQGTHIDTTICVIGYNTKIQKFIVLVCGPRVTPKNMPAIFRGKNWVVLQINEVQDQKTNYEEYFISSSMIALNFLTINSQLIMMNDQQTKIHKALEHYGIEVMKMPHKQARHIGGGFHCMSNQLKRKDVYGFKDTLNTPKENLSKEKLAGLFDSELLQFLEKKGDIQEWVQICNQNSIYPTYLTDHMSPEQKKEIQQRHQNLIKNN